MNNMQREKTLTGEALVNYIMKRWNLTRNQAVSSPPSFHAGTVRKTRFNGEASAQKDIKFKKKKGIMFRFIKKLFKKFRPTYNLVYRKKNGKTKLYRVNGFNLNNQFDNQAEGERNVGVRAWCYSRQGIRSFRYEGIISLTKN